MQLQLQTFTSLVSGATAAVQGSARQLVDLSVGSTLRAVLESSAAVGLWMQWLILQVLRMTRAATSEGPDLDSWVFDFGMVRLEAIRAHGLATFSRFVPTGAALIPADSEVRCSDGSQTFVVVADGTHPDWSAAQGGFLLGAGQAEVTVPIAATLPGESGNVQAGAITLIASALPGVDMVANNAALSGGLDAESDTALRARFLNFMDSRSRATAVAIKYAINSVRQGLNYTLAENQAPDGSSRMGCFTLTIEDGTGSASDALIATIAAAVEAVRPIGTSYSVRRPAISAAQVSLQVVVDDAALAAEARRAVVAEVTSYVEALPIGAPLAWSRLTQVAYDAHPAVTNVFNVLVNGGTLDVVPGAGSVVKVASLTVD